MKKLLIATMAAVSVGLCVKAEDTGFISGTSFETFPEGSYLATNGVSERCKWYNPDGSELRDAESGLKYWKTKATDAQVVVSNLSFFASELTEDKRPEKWKSDSNSKALLIDTDGPLERWVYYSANDVDPQGMNIPEGGLFFDSVVQFTATDVAVEPDNADKLRVWLYSSPEDVATTPGLFKETTPKTCLVVTAGFYDGADGLMGNLTHNHYEITGIDVQPDTWHRLTIKAIADIDPTEANVTPGFEIWVDGTPVTYGVDKTQFPSLKEADSNGNETLHCVAFDGKGAVDDIVFTTTDPFYVPPVEAEKANVKVTFNDLAGITADGIYFYVNGQEYGTIDALTTNYELDVESSVSVQFMLQEGYELVAPNVQPNGDGAYEVTIDALTAEGATIAIEIKKTSGSDTVTVDGTTVEFGNDGKIANITTAFDGKAVSGELDTTKFKSYYTAEVKDGILSIKLDQKAAAPFAEATEDKEVLEVGEDASGNPELTVRIKPYVGLFYGAMTGSALDNLTLTSDYKEATTTEVIEFTVTGKAGDTAGFIKVVVTDIAPESTEK